MARITIDDLKEMLVKAGGEGADVPSLDGDAVDKAFADLGYDSLALLEVVGKLELTYDITLEEEATQPGGTPRELLDLVNGMLNAAA
ncbi:phosphopantetheine-binding protein [Actinacidiphila rubida]|uniref:Act minimal PKS acyl carrier protein n=1 Tax=Actinacidiphila rubida TaxID=310780 RepID=A0A1H8EI50_9ACTN|nr:phosphopantetheine-binding protein [Actinacidiphila rubida]SEN18557.1 act minimal PKS acyl carrier protein [Actinacidiphila rubida]